MKKMTLKRIENISGGGCMKWIRRYNRAVRNGIDDEQYLRSLIWAFEECIDAQY
jgi:hypothetical protein